MATPNPPDVLIPVWQVQAILAAAGQMVVKLWHLCKCAHSHTHLAVWPQVGSCPPFDKLRAVSLSNRSWPP